jgi:molybdopterin synthase sulfur carrier subunit
VLAGRSEASRSQKRDITAAQVWDQLELGPLESVCVAVNQELVRADQPLRAGDELAFLPPFTGG